MLLLLVLLAAQGCQNDEGRMPDFNSGTVIGTLPAGGDSRLLFVDSQGKKLEVTPGVNGSFMAQVAPGRYDILLKNASGSLTLVKRSVIVEDNKTINLLEVSMVPIPQVISVAVPIVYSDSVIIEWETDIGSDGRIDYGKDQGYGFSSYTTQDLKTIHRVQLFALDGKTAYHFRVVASRHGLESVQTFSNDYVFSTE